MNTRSLTLLFSITLALVLAIGYGAGCDDSSTLGQSGNGGYPYGSGGYGTGGAQCEGTGGYSGTGGDNTGNYSGSGGYGACAQGTGGVPWGGTGGYSGTGGDNTGGSGSGGGPWRGTGGDNTGGSGSGGVPWNGSGGVGSGGVPWGGSGGVPWDGSGGAGTGGAPGLQCPTPGSASTPTTVDAFRTAITRKWRLCSGEGLGQVSGGGIEIKPDNRYWQLVPNSAGQLVGMTGVDFEGTVSYGLTDFGAVQTTFRSDLNVIFVVAPVITANPTMLIMKTTTSDYRYIPVTP